MREAQANLELRALTKGVSVISEFSLFFSLFFSLSFSFYDMCALTAIHRVLQEGISSLLGTVENSERTLNGAKFLASRSIPDVLFLCLCRC